MNSNPKILLVDDNAINIRVAAKILRDNKYDTTIALNGKLALEYAAELDFDLILLDIMMPKMDGYEVCEKLKNESKTRNVPVIFLTAKTGTEDLVKAFELGGADYVTKPFNDRELLSRVETQIKLKKAREELENTNRKLQEANDTKDKMFSIISHDMLGPFGNMRESLKLIVNQKVAMDVESMKTFIKAMWNSVNSAYSLLENLLHWARSQRGRMVYKPEKIDMNKLIQENIILTSEIAKSKLIKLKSEPATSFEVFADKNAVMTILRNLISNAIKFTEPGGTVTIRAESKNHDFVVVSVTDNGIGMNEQIRKNLFNKFKNEPGWGTKGEKGVGLGLVISKEFVEKNGGEIWVESEQGKGSAFYFTLPVL